MLEVIKCIKHKDKYYIVDDEISIKYNKEIFNGTIYKIEDNYIIIKMGTGRLKMFYIRDIEVDIC